MVVSVEGVRVPVPARSVSTLGRSTSAAGLFGFHPSIHPHTRIRVVSAILLVGFTDTAKETGSYLLDNYNHV